MKLNKHSDSQDIINEIEMVTSKQKKLNSASNVEEQESMESRPLKLDESLNVTQQISMKHPKIRASESPQVFNSQKNNLSFKHFINSVKEKGKD